MAAGSDVTEGGRSNTIQWSKVPLGASGSSTMSANEAVPNGAPLQVSGGEIFSPSQEYCFGIDTFARNAELVSVNASPFAAEPTGVVVGDGDALVPPLQASRTTVETSRQPAGILIGG